jgi:hypothetical protein
MRNMHVDERPKWAWRAADKVIMAAVLGLTWAVGPWWLTVVVLLYGLWNYVDGMVRAEWKSDRPK